MKRGISMSDNRRTRHRFHHRRFIFILIVLLITVLLSFASGMALGSRKNTPSEITSDLLGQKLRTAKELVTVNYYYTNMGKFENQVDFYGWKVPFTSKSFIVSYDGILKAGVNLDSSEITVDEVTHTITITLPSSQILSHEIPAESIQIFDETHNIFNPISLSDYKAFTIDQKEAAEIHAIENGLLTSADEKACAEIEEFLGFLPGIRDYTLTVRTAERSTE